MVEQQRFPRPGNGIQEKLVTKNLVFKAKFCQLGALYTRPCLA